MDNIEESSVNNIFYIDEYMQDIDMESVAKRIKSIYPTYINNATTLNDGGASSYINMKETKVEDAKKENEKENAEKTGAHTAAHEAIDNPRDLTIGGTSAFVNINEQDDNSSEIDIFGNIDNSLSKTDIKENSDNNKKLMDIIKNLGENS